MYLNISWGTVEFVGCSLSIPQRKKNKQRCLHGKGINYTLLTRRKKLDARLHVTIDQKRTEI